MSTRKKNAYMQIDKAALRASCLKVSAQKMNGIYYYIKNIITWKYYIIFKCVRNRAKADGKADDEDKDAHASQGREQGRIVWLEKFYF